jgi:hypothetical protein
LVGTTAVFARSCASRTRNINRLRDHETAKIAHATANRLTSAKDDPRVERTFPTFLARAYRLKELADYAIGHDARVSVSEAEEAIEMASRFLENISTLLSTEHEP